MDAVEDILLDDFSLGDDSEEEQQNDSGRIERSMSIDSIN